MCVNNEVTERESAFSRYYKELDALKDITSILKQYGFICVDYRRCEETWIGSNWTIHFTQNIQPDIETLTKIRDVLFSKGNNENVEM